MAFISIINLLLEQYVEQKLPYFGRIIAIVTPNSIFRGALGECSGCTSGHQSSGWEHWSKLIIWLERKLCKHLLFSAPAYLQRLDGSGWQSLIQMTA